MKVYGNISGGSFLKSACHLYENKTKQCYVWSIIIL